MLIKTQYPKNSVLRTNIELPLDKIAEIDMHQWQDRLLFLSKSQIM